MKATGLLIALTLVSCAEREANDALPEPSIVSPSEVAEDSDRVYYLANSGAQTREEAEQLLLALLEDQIPVVNAWFPRSGSTCECAMCVACIVVELDTPDPKITAHEFGEDPGGWVCNCGVDGMWHYGFDSP